MTASLDFLEVIQKGIIATRDGKYKEALTNFNRVYTKPIDETSPAKKAKYIEGMSYYGLAIAIAEKKYKMGADLCRSAIEAQFYNADHYSNLVLIYLQAGSRRRAVEALEQALRALPNDSRLKVLAKSMGTRAHPVIPFLRRDHPINVALGKARHARLLKKDKQRRR